MKLRCRKIGHRWVLERLSYDMPAKIYVDTFDEALAIMRTFTTRRLHAVA